jgi:hypothetical protein
MDTPEKPSRRKLILSVVASAAGVLALGAAVLVDARFVEPRWLRIDRREIALAGSRLTSPISILHLSDFHVCGLVPYAFIEKAVRMGLAEKPDLICLTGDLIVRQINLYDRYRDILRQLSSAAPTFACVGNHDGGRWAASYGGYADLTEVKNLLRESNITCLVNESTSATIRGQAIKLVGLGDLWAGEMRPTDSLFTRDADRTMPVIVLCHNPDSKESLSPYAWDLMLCGHTHGGQLRLPIIGTPLAPVRDHRYVEGLHRWNDRYIYITRGVGNLHGMRFNCRPWVSVIRFGG